MARISHLKILIKVSNVEKSTEGITSTAANRVTRGFCSFVNV
jgi:hypothetical protein